MTMQAIFVQDGESLDYTPTAYTPAGTVIVQGPMVGITKHEIQPNILGAIAADGVFYVEKDNSAFSGGGPIYWNPAELQDLDARGAGRWRLCHQHGLRGHLHGLCRNRGPFHRHQGLRASA